MTRIHDEQYHAPYVLSHQLETIAVHAGAAIDPETGAIVPPIHLSTTFEHAADAKDTHGYLYIREGNPTQARLEAALSALEAGEEALVFASGIAAGAALIHAVGPGAHIILPDDMYVTVRTLIRDLLAEWGAQSTDVDMQDLAMVERAFQTNTRLLWVETPSNPLMKVIDISALTTLAHDHGVPVVVDNTIATPILQRPLKIGADIVLHSTTKYIGGHSDVQGGVLIFKKKGARVDRVREIRRLTGGVASPFNSWLVLRGIHTLACRMTKHSSNATALAQAMSQWPTIERVHYPGLTSHPNHAVARKQMTDFGGLLSIQVKGGKSAAVRALSRLRLFTVATSFGGVESLIEHRSSSEGRHSQAPENLIRISAGLEHREDLIADLREVFA